MRDSFTLSNNFICNVLFVLEIARRYFEESLTRFNFLAISAYTCSHTRPRTCIPPVSSKFSHGQIALLGTVRKDIVAAGESPEGDPGYFSCTRFRFTFPTDTSATRRAAYLHDFNEVSRNSVEIRDSFSGWADVRKRVVCVPATNSRTEKSRSLFLPRNMTNVPGGPITTVRRRDASPADKVTAVCAVSLML